MTATRLKPTTTTGFFIRKSFFCVSLNFLNIMLEIRLRFFLTFISLFSLIVYLIMFNTNNKLYFLTYTLTGMSNSTQYKRMFSAYWPMLLLLCYCNTTVKQQLCREEWYHKKLFKFDFAAIFVAFAPGLLTRLYHRTTTESP